MKTNKTNQGIVNDGWPFDMVLTIFSKLIGHQV